MRVKIVVAVKVLALRQLCRHHAARAEGAFCMAQRRELAGPPVQFVVAGVVAKVVGKVIALVHAGCKHAGVHVSVKMLITSTNIRVRR